jgi:hypothetical protein
LSDSGLEIGKALGFNVVEISRSKWKNVEFYDVAINSSGAGFEAPLISISNIARNTLLITGFHGDKAWNRDVKDTTSNIVRGDNTGQSLTEWRLWVNAIHVPVPFFSIRSFEQINAISNSSELKKLGPAANIL